MKNRRYGFTHSGGVHNIIVEKELHLVGKRSLTGKDIFPLQVAVHHKDDCRIIIHFLNDDRHCLQTCQLCCMKPTVSRKNFKSAFRVRSDNQR